MKDTAEHTKVIIALATALNEAAEVARLALLGKTRAEILEELDISDEHADILQRTLERSQSARNESLEREIAMLRDEPAPRPAYVDPTYLGKVQDIIADLIVVTREDLPADKLLEDLGIDSLDSVLLVIELDEAFGLDIQEHQLSEWKTVGDIASFIQREKDPV